MVFGLFSFLDAAEKCVFERKVSLLIYIINNRLDFDSVTYSEG